MTKGQRTHATEDTMKSRILFWVLTDGKNLYFCDWTDIGPRNTRDPKKAARFRTKRAATGSSAYAFSLMFYEPMAIRKGTFGEALTK